MPDKSEDSFNKKKFSKNIYIFFLIVLVLILLILFVYISKAIEIQNNADKLGAKVDWQAVMTNKPPYYLVEHKAIQIQYDNADAFRQRISELGIEIDPWETYEHEVVAGASKLNIQKLQDNGYNVTILANSYEEYFNSPEFKKDRGVRIGHDQ